MKKLFVILVALCLFLLPHSVLAASEPINIYLFRGKGCPHCEEFLEYVNDTLLSKYEGQFNLISYEVWNNEDNSKLMDEVSDFRGDGADGIPYIIIGNSSIVGFGASDKAKVEEEIEKLIATDPSERYDVFREMQIDNKDFDLSETMPLDLEATLNDEGIVLNTEKLTSATESKSNTFGIIVSEIVIAGISLGIGLYVNNKNKKEILEAIKYGHKK